ncbi:MAG: tRNA(Ile)-lysidine synthetase [Candidatus Sulfotelmatobacter sp.]|nr:tRNA(Ile)-lysidine synthetase [Candidatus Sulfotelmatobacter sp.]
MAHIRREELLRPGDRVGVAVSGGIDSVALLRLLIELRQELGIVLSVVHFNHQLRGAESDADQEFVAELARKHGLEFYSASGDVARQAAEEHSSVEAAARELRYGFFHHLLSEEDGTSEAAAFPTPIDLPPSQVHLDKIATGHTLDDQAETVLMRMIRGTGLRGLGGIHPRLVGEDEDGESHGEIVRPLLGMRRHELQQFLGDLKQPWREDPTNADSRFTRNRVRKLVLPLLEREFNPTVVENFAELAEIAREEEDYWENEISGWLGTVVQWSQPEWTRGLPGFDSQPLVQIQPSRAQLPEAELLERLEQPGPAIMNASVSRPWLLTEPKAVQRRVLKAIGEKAGIPLEFKHIEHILRFAAEDGPSGKELSLPLGWKIVREAETVLFLTPDLRRQERIPDYEYSLPVPGSVAIPALGLVIEALLVGPGSQIAEYNRQHLLRAELLPGPLTVRNWRAGDRFWPAHTKVPKKIKEFLQERHVAQPERRLWPVIASGDEIVWMRGFPAPIRLRAEAQDDAVLIQEWPASEQDSI